MPFRESGVARGQGEGTGQRWQRPQIRKLDPRKMTSTAGDMDHRATSPPLRSWGWAAGPPAAIKDRPVPTGRTAGSKSGASPHGTGAPAAAAGETKRRERGGRTVGVLAGGGVGGEAAARGGRRRLEVRGDRADPALGGGVLHCSR